MIAMAASVTTVLLNSFGGLLSQQNSKKTTGKSESRREAPEDAHGAGLETVTFKVPGIHCSGCIKTIEMAVAGYGVSRVQGDTHEKLATLYFSSGDTNEEELRKRIESVGYEVI
jgi:copper chaperone CopZ